MVVFCITSKKKLKKNDRMGYISITGNGILSTEFILSVWLSSDVSLQGVKWIPNCQRAGQSTDKHGSWESFRWEIFQERGECLNRYLSSWNWCLPHFCSLIPKKEHTGSCLGQIRETGRYLHSLLPMPAPPCKSCSSVYATFFHGSRQPQF